jgi:hypothetical protein
MSFPRANRERAGAAWRQREDNNNAQQVGTQSRLFPGVLLMKRVLACFLRLAVFGFAFFLSTTFFAMADASDKTIASHDAEVEGVKLHYMTAGHGTPLILLHGYAETSLMWKPIIPVLAQRFMVIAPDLPGIGDSAIPADGLDMKTAAIRIHALARSLGVQKAEVVGHDIGLMVAYAQEHP